MAAVVLGGCGSADQATDPPPAPSGQGGSGTSIESTTPPVDTGDEAAGEAGNGGAGGEAGQPTIYPTDQWPTAAPADVGLDAAQLEAAASVAEGLDSHCLLVIRHGKLVFERYYQGHDPLTPQVSWSIAKSYTSALVGIAIDRGDIGSIDDSVAIYLPELKGTAREMVTIRHLLSMTSGLKWSAFEDYIVMAAFAKDHSAHALKLDVDKAPDSEWIYHNAGVQLLEPLFRSATGKSIEAYAAEHLWSRIGMDASWAHDPSGNPTAYASVLASCRDHARLGYLYLHSGNWVGEQVLLVSWIAQILLFSQPFNRAYGFLWWLNAETPAVDAMMQPWDGRMTPAAPPDMFAARGFGNQFIDVIPSLDLIVVRFGSDPMNKLDLIALFDDQRFEKHDAILKQVLDAVVD